MKDEVSPRARGVLRESEVAEALAGDLLICNRILENRTSVWNAGTEEGRTVVCVGVGARLWRVKLTWEVGRMFRTIRLRLRLGRWPGGKKHRSQ